MPVYRGERFIAAAIESVLAQTYREFELVVVNDGSPDRSAEAIRPFLPHPQIRYIEQQNAGVAAARNTGIAASSGAFVGLLDQDDLWLPDKLEQQIAYFRSHPEVGLVHSRVECIDETGAPRTCEGAILVRPFTGLCAGQLLLGSAIAGVTVLVRKQCLDRVGRFDQQFAPADDWELWVRIARLYPLGFLDRVTAKYRFHGENVSRDQFKMQQAVLRIMDSVCHRFPDVPKGVNPVDLAAARSRVLTHAAEALRARGRRREARSYWREAYKTNGDFEALLAIIGIPARTRKRMDKLLDSMPRLSRLLRWYLYRVLTRLWARVPTTTRPERR